MRSKEQDYLKRQIYALSKKQTPVRAIYSWNCFDHSTSLRDAGFNHRTASNTTMGNALLLLLQAVIPTDTKDRAQSPGNLVWMDDCQGFSCGSGCNAFSTPM